MANMLGPEKKKPIVKRLELHLMLDDCEVVIMHDAGGLFLYSPEGRLQIHPHSPDHVKISVQEKKK